MSVGEHFARADLWPLLLVAPLLWPVLAARAAARRRRLLRSVGPRADALAPAASARGRRIGDVAFCAGLLLLAVALLQPLLGEKSQLLEERGVDIVLALDVSRSMLAADLAPNRLARARAQIRELAAHAAGERLALVLFAGAARLAAPLTRDVDAIVALADLADPQSIGRGGTDLAAALEVALAALDHGGAGGGSIVLLTDGEDLQRHGLRAAEACRARGARVHCVGFGARQGGKIPIETAAGTHFLRDRDGREVISAMDAQSLGRLATAGGGRFVDAGRERAPLVDLYRDTLVHAARQTFASDRRSERHGRYQWPLLAALVLLGCEFAALLRGRP